MVKVDEVSPVVAAFRQNAGERLARPALWRDAATTSSSDPTVVLTPPYSYNLCTNWYVTVPEEEMRSCSVSGRLMVRVSPIFDFRSLLANLHGSLAVTDGAVSGWLKRTLYKQE
ncbi:MAG: hypothetical protein JWN70_2815 [Planctomycetaceae bacterium]|nr:hypothetical protein [Planctomycetaceae bacterium]